MTDHQTALLELLKLFPVRGARVETILKRTGMTRKELAAAGDGLGKVVTKEKTTDWNFCYRITPEKRDMTGIAASREAVPMHQLPPYTGETRRAGAVL